MHQRVRHGVAPCFDLVPSLLKFRESAQRRKQDPPVIRAEMVTTKMRADLTARCAQLAQVMVGTSVAEKHSCRGVHAVGVHGRKPPGGNNLMVVSSILVRITNTVLYVQPRPRRSLVGD